MSVFRYPLRKLDTAEDYIQIDILDYVPSGFKTKEDSFALRSSDDTLLNSGDLVEKIKQSIILPIPQGIGDSMNVGWGESRINPFQATLADLATDVMTTSGNPLKAAQKSLTDTINKVKTTGTAGTTKRAINAALAGGAINALTGQNLNLIGRATGAIFNPNVELLFSQVNLRPAFTFSFDMIPRFQKESTEVKNIIRLFKQSMAPKKNNNVSNGLDNTSGVFIKSPDVYRLRYMNGGRIHPFLNRFKICALTNMNVDYTGAGTYATYSDATPVHMKVSLTFNELTPIYAEDYDEGQGTGGVGY